MSSNCHSPMVGGSITIHSNGHLPTRQFIQIVDSLFPSSHTAQQLSIVPPTITGTSPNYQLITPFEQEKHSSISFPLESEVKSLTNHRHIYIVLFCIGSSTNFSFLSFMNFVATVSHSVSQLEILIYSLLTTSQQQHVVKYIPGQ